MRYVRIAWLLSALPWGCSRTAGEPVDPAALGYRACQAYFDCGEGRFCSEDGTCLAQCRTTADCGLFGEGLICNRFGQCLDSDGAHRCTRHEDCGEGRYCNGVCNPTSLASCGSAADCPYEYETCEGKCAAHCGVDDHCRETCSRERCSVTLDRCQSDGDCDRLTGQECTPVGQCMWPGWERWIPPGQLPPTSCNRDAECKLLGFHHECDCDKEIDAHSGLELCAGGGQGVCVESTGTLDFGEGPPSSPAHALRGVWGLRVEIAVLTVGLPIVGSHNSYSSTLFLVKASHHAGDTLELEERVCEINIINFNDDDTPYQDMIRMVIPHQYLRSLSLLAQTAEIASGEPNADFVTSQSLELRGCLLDDPHNDPLPTRADFVADPGDPRIWDQDEDGKPGMTVFVDGVLRGELYNVQRWTAIHRGEILDSDHVRGLTTAASEEILLDSSNPQFNLNTQTSMHPHADRTYFRLMRVPDDTSCADLIREAHHADSWLRHTEHLMDVDDP